MVGLHLNKHGGDAGKSLAALPAGRSTRESLRQVAALRLDGYTDSEIAARLGCGLTTIERRLRTIRTVWTRRG